MEDLKSIEALVKELKAVMPRIIPESIVSDDIAGQILERSPLEDETMLRSESHPAFFKEHNNGFSETSASMYDFNDGNYFSVLVQLNAHKEKYGDILNKLERLEREDPTFVRLFKKVTVFTTKRQIEVYYLIGICKVRPE